jgi:hypothetical protein
MPVIGHLGTQSADDDYKDFTGLAVQRPQASERVSC